MKFLSRCSINQNDKVNNIKSFIPRVDVAENTINNLIKYQGCSQ